ncbi:MAG: head GIN domain-containing protein [Pseudomonadota bacterium]
MIDQSRLLPRRLLAGLAAAGAVAIAAGPAVAETRTYDLDGFDVVYVSSGIYATVTIGESFVVEIEAAQRDLDRLDVRVKDGELKIGRNYRGLSWGRERGRIDARVTLPNLTGLEASSGADVTATDVDAGSFGIDASSGASIDVAGACENASVDVSSGASVDAEGLICNDVDVDASSGASARVHAAERVTADASSGASVRVFGDPQQKQSDTSSGGSVRY